MNQTLADAGHMLVSAGAFVFEDDVMAGSQLDRDGVQLQVCRNQTLADAGHMLVSAGAVM